MLNATKVNAWMKRAVKKETRCFYNAEEMWVSDGFAIVMLAGMPDSVKFTLQGLFGGLDESKVAHRQGGIKASNVPSYEEILDRNPEVLKTVIDSKLKFEKTDVKPKFECRVLYDPDTKEKIIINQKYAELFKNFEDLKLIWHKPKTRRGELVNLFEGERLVGLIAPIYFQAWDRKTVLDTFEFIDHE